MVVELLLALEEPLHRPQKLARFSALDHPVIVGAADHHHLAEPEGGDLFEGQSGVLGRIVDGADRDDAPLARHQPRDRRNRPKAARIGQRHGGASKIVRHQLVGASLLDQGFVHPVEPGEVQSLRVLEHRDDQAPTAVFAFGVNGNPEIDALGVDPMRHPIGHGEGVGHHRMGGRRSNQGVADQVGKRELLGPSRGLRRGVEFGPAGLQRSNRDLPECRGGRNRQTFVHVDDQPGCRTFQRLAARHRRGPIGCLGTGGRGSHDRRALTDSAAVEELPPFGSHAGRILEVILVDRLRKAGVGGFEDIRIGHFWHSVLGTRLSAVGIISSGLGGWPGRVRGNGRLLRGGGSRPNRVLFPSAERPFRRRPGRRRGSRRQWKAGGT